MDEFVNISYFSPIKIARENIKRAMCEVAPKYARGKLIDMGCGTKPYESIFKKHVDSYFGVDYPDTASVNYGEKTKADHCADCTETGLDPDSFDTLLSTQAMEHVFDTKKFIAECYRLLKTGGKGIFTIPFLWQCHAEPYDYHRFTKYAIDSLFKEGGFKVLELKTLEGAYAALMQATIVSLYTIKKGDNFFLKVAKKLRNFLMIPASNWKGLNLDKVFQNDKLCINYLAVVEKK